MIWREWALDGVYVSPYLIAFFAALLITVMIRLLLNQTSLGRWIWHEALFDSALFICVLGAVVAWMVNR